MSKLDEARVLDALRGVVDPDLKKDLVTLGMVRDVAIDGGRVSLRVVLTTPACPLKAEIERQVVLALRSAGAEDVKVTMDAEVRRPAAPGGGPAAPQGPRLPGVKSVLSVGSGKGGVGKSTVAANLAVALSRAGAKVGLLDADIYGPSLPTMLGLKTARPTATDDGRRILPIERYGLKVMSMGFMLDPDQAVVWRGPMLGKALQQLLEDVVWGELDYLVVDMPPGTGDVQLSLSQLLPVSGAVVVTTPQDVAFADVRRAIKMFEMTRTPVLGIVENMSHFVCDACGTEHLVFGEGKTAQHAARLGLEVLSRLPLDGVTAIAADRGEPIVVAEPDAPSSEAYRRCAARVAQKLAILAHETADPADRFRSFFAMEKTLPAAGA